MSDDNRKCIWDFPNAKSGDKVRFFAYDGLFTILEVMDDGSNPGWMCKNEAGEKIWFDTMDGIREFEIGAN